MLLFRRENDCVGLDIGSYSIKAVEFKSKKAGEKVNYKIKKIGFEPVPRDAIVDGNIVDPAAVVETIKMIFEENKISNKNIVISISGNSVIIKKISLPPMEMKELEESIKWEAQHNIPYPYEETNIDYAILNPPQHSEAENLDILLVAAKKDKISDYSSIIYQAKKKPEAIEVDSLAIQNSMEINYPEIFFDKTLAIINIGANITNVLITDKGIPWLFRDLSLGSSLISENLSKDLNISFDDAEKILRGYPPQDVQPEKFQPILEQNIKNILTEIKKTFSYFKTGGKKDKEIELIFLSGGFSKYKDLSSYIEENFKIKTEIFDPFRKISYDEKKIDPLFIKEMSAHFAVASGLATRGKTK